MSEVRVSHLLIALGMAILFIMYLQTEEEAWSRCTTTYSNATCVAILQR